LAHQTSQLGVFTISVVQITPNNSEVKFTTFRVNKYGNEGPNNPFSKMAYNTVQKVYNCFSIEVIIEVTKMNVYVNKHPIFKHSKLFNHSFVV